MEKHTHRYLVFYGHVLSLKHLQATRLISFHGKTVYEITKLWQIDRLDEVEMNRGIGMLDKGTLPMPLGYPRALSPGCGTDSK
jgi:hypothetical protein